MRESCSHRCTVRTLLVGTILLQVASLACRPLAVSAQPLDNASTVLARRELLSDVLTDQQWQAVDRSVNRGLEWIASQQNNQGEFRAGRPDGQPAITSLCILAFLSCGHQPDLGPYGKQLNRAVDYVLSCQLDDGLFSRVKPPNYHVMRRASHTATYNHAISGVMLGEVYGMSANHDDGRLAKAIERGLARSRRLQLQKKQMPIDVGGWRYTVRSQGAPEYDSDLSVTAWHLMFYRSARNAGFDVPQRFAREATAYVRRCHIPPDSPFRNRGTFSYLAGVHHWTNHAMTGCGLLTLALAGEPSDPLCRDAAEWLLKRPSRSNRWRLVSPTNGVRSLTCVDVSINDLRFASPANGLTSLGSVETQVGLRLGGERIDLVRWNESLKVFISGFIVRRRL